MKAREPFLIDYFQRQTITICMSLLFFFFFKHFEMFMLATFLLNSSLRNVGTYQHLKNNFFLLLFTKGESSYKISQSLLIFKLVYQFYKYRPLGQFHLNLLKNVCMHGHLPFLCPLLTFVTGTKYVAFNFDSDT